ncbi:MAG: nuclear transport factor 2 family protein [Bacillota bacterium]
MTQSAVDAGRDTLEQAVTRFFHMCNTHCPGNLAPLMTPDVECLADRAAKGQEEVHAYFVELWEAYPKLTFLVQNVLVDGSGAAAEVTYTDGPHGSGARCLLFQFRGNLIRRIRCY